MYGKWDNGLYEIRKVENGEKTYIPTTTIGISGIGSKIEARQSHDEVNLLSKRRRNKLISESVEGSVARVGIESYKHNSYFEGNTKYAYTYNKGYKIESVNFDNLYEVLIEVNYGSTMTYLTFPLNKNGVKHTFDENYDMVFMNWNGLADVTYTYKEDNTLDLALYIGSVNPSTITAYLVREAITYQLDTKNISTIEPIKIWANGELVTDMSGITLDYTNGLIQFPLDFIENNKPIIEGENNLIVEFTKVVEGNADKINNCMFGAFFGYNDIEHLFVSGNSKMPNFDFHSIYPDPSETQSGIPVYDDLTYFGDLSYARLGSIQSKIIGYTLLEDGTLAIHKEANKNEPSIYLRTAVIDDVVDLSGNIIYDQNGNPYQKVYYSQYAGNISEGMISRFGSGNLAGDKLFLSKNGVFGIIMNPNIKSNERFARERSRLINPKLTKETYLENACAIVFDNRYYLSINGKCYIADARFRNQLKAEMDDTFSYEWWVWNNVNARIWFVSDNMLYFGTKNGQICVFDNNSYIDRYYEKIDNGGIMLDSESNSFVINALYNDIIANLKDGDTLKLKEASNNIIASKVVLSSEIISVNKGVVKVDFDTFYEKVRFIENRQVYMNNNASWYYIVKNLDNENLSFELWKNGETLDTNLNTKDDISIKLNDIDVYIKNMDYENGTFQISNFIGDIYNVYSYQNVVLNIIGYFDIKKNVNALWLTPIFNLGTTEYSKNLHSITLTPESLVGGKIDFGFKTRANEGEFAVGGVSLLDFNDIDFTNFTFETSTFAKSDTRKTNVKNFNFIQFYFKNDNDKDCVVNDLSITYSVGKINKGVR